jgi:hypothetical protein
MPAGNTYESIATQTLGSSSGSITFSSIPSTYTDLVIVFSGTTAALVAVDIQFNGDTSTNYSRTIISGNGSTASSDREVNQPQSSLGLSSTTQSDTIWQVF